MPKIGVKSSISEAIKQKSSLTKRDEELNRALSLRYDALNQQFATAESLLKSLKPHRSVFIYYGHHTPENGGPTVWETLGLMKYNNQWRIVHGFGSELDEYGAEVVPIVERPVDVRVRAATEMRKLHAEIVSEKEKFIPEVDAAIKELVDFCDEI